MYQHCEAKNIRESGNILKRGACILNPVKHVKENGNSAAINLATPKATFASKIITGLNVRRAPAHAAWVAEVVCEDFVCEARSRICTADLKTAWLRAEMYCGIRMGQHTGHRMSPFRILGNGMKNEG